MTDEELTTRLLEIDALVIRLRASHDRLLAAAKRALAADDDLSEDYGAMDALQAVVAAAEELAP